MQQKNKLHTEVAKQQYSLIFFTFSCPSGVQRLLPVSPSNETDAAKLAWFYESMWCRLQTAVLTSVCPWLLIYCSWKVTLVIHQDWLGHFGVPSPRKFSKPDKQLHLRCVIMIMIHDLSQITSRDVANRLTRDHWSHCSGAWGSPITVQ